MSKPPKIDRKDLRTPDEFVKKGTAIVDVLAHQRNWLLPVIGVVAIIGAAVAGWNWWDGKRLEKTWDAFEVAKKAAEPQRWDELKKIYETHPKNRGTLFAVAALGDHYFDLAKKNDGKDANPDAAAAAATDASAAADWYGKAVEFSGLSQMEKQLLTLNRGESFELDKKYDQAIADYDKAAEMGGNLKALALLERGRVLELKGDAAKAKEAYEKVSADFFSSEYARMAKNNLRRMKSPVLNQKF